jgi:hypothetical protein
VIGDWLIVILKQGREPACILGASIRTAQAKPRESADKK